MDVDMEDKDPQTIQQGFHNWTLFPQWQELHNPGYLQSLTVKQS
jgi:hypothetical protein